MSRKQDWLSVVLIILLVPVTILIVDAIYPIVKFDQKYAQIILDALLILIAVICNFKFWKLKVTFFNTEHILKQVLNMIPLLVFMLFFGKFNNLGFPKAGWSVFLTVLLIGLGEEYVYRGLLMAQLEKNLHSKPFLVILISSVSFGLIHIGNMFNVTNKWVVVAQMIMAAASGMLYGTLYNQTHNLSLAIMFHIFDDLPMLFSKSTATAESLFPKQQLVQFLLITLVIFAICSLIAFLQLKLNNLHFKKHSEIKI